MNHTTNVQIYVISHSPQDIIHIKTNEIYTPLFVGRNGKNNLGFASDDSGDNISAKNKDYCELTGLYWIWKHSKADIIGLCHYRRYFNSDKGFLIQKEEILDYLKDNDIILPKKTSLIKGSYWETYQNHYLLDVLKIAGEIISKISPDYLNTFEKIMAQDEFYNYNMFIAPKELIISYCNWIFPILEEIENRINLNDYPRVLGLVSEAIFNVWIEKQNLKIKECNVRYLGNKLKLRMFLINQPILRKFYQFFYNAFFKKSKANKLEKTIQNIFYK